MWGIPCGMLLVAPGDWPYSYYTALRVVVCLFAALFAFSAIQIEPGNWTKFIVGGNVVIALLYNLFLPVHLGNKDVWSGVNLATVAVLTVTVVVLWGRPVADEERKDA